MKAKNILLVLCVVFSHSAFAESELPEQGEIFSSYFARLTRGGAFPGIRLQAGEKFQDEFFNKIRKGFWVGIRNQEMSRLKKQGVDIWFDWYQTTKPLSVLERSTRIQDVTFFPLLREDTKRRCSSEILDRDWASLGRCEREILSKAILFRLRDFTGKTMVGQIAEYYGLQSHEIEDSTDIYLEDSDGFKERVCRMGYCGDIYFRGITGPDPLNPLRRWIVLNHELMVSMSPFERPLLQMLEYAGILSHELNHVAQDLAGIKFGLDIQVRDAESALLIEGMAEFNNQKIWQKFSGASQPDNPFALFSAEQGVEIVYREGNSSSGRLFPYTIGLPFVAAYFSYKNGIIPVVQEDLLRVLGAKQSLPSLLTEK